MRALIGEREREREREGDGERGEKERKGAGGESAKDNGIHAGLLSSQAFPKTGQIVCCCVKHADLQWP